MTDDAMSLDLTVPVSQGAALAEGEIAPTDFDDITNFVPAQSIVRLVMDTLTLMNQNTVQHQVGVAYLCYMIAREMKLSTTVTYLTMEAGMLHDIGGSILGQRVTVDDIEANQEGAARASADLLEEFPLLKPDAKIIRCSQKPFFRDEPGWEAPPVESQIIHLSDAFNLLLDHDTAPLNQVEGIMKTLEPYVGTEFSPQVFEALRALKRRDKIWFDLFYNPSNLVSEVIDERFVSLKHTLVMTAFISTLIDFRSPFTAMHSAGVAASAKALAGFVGLSKQECYKIEIAGNLHDLGKLRTPKAILEKPGKLTPEEFNIIKEHAFFTYETLKKIPGFDDVAQWAAFHHEKLNGRGYPLALEAGDIPLGAKIMAVADVFSAIMEDRPYRTGMPRERALAILDENADSGALSAELIAILKRHFDEIDRARSAASARAGARYYASFHERNDFGERG